MCPAPYVSNRNHRQHGDDHHHSDNPAALPKNVRALDLASRIAAAAALSTEAATPAGRSSALKAPRLTGQGAMGFIGISSRVTDASQPASRGFGRLATNSTRTPLAQLA